VPEPALIITADDFGYSPRYDEGILEAARAGAVDAVSVLVRGGAVGSLAQAKVEIGLHLDISAKRSEAMREAQEQVRRFEELFGAPPAYLDGHHHSHAAPSVAAGVGQLARELGAPVRSVDDRHRRLLRALGVNTQDHVIGRLDQSEPVMPPEIQSVLDGGALPSGVTEWIVHPGHMDPSAGSRYDTGRGEDLALVLDLANNRKLREARTSHAAGAH
jgi:predicted glycoside hydrolase/deacetylase ChbG (UPF0249 family)